MPQTERENRDPGRRYVEREFKIASVASLEPQYFEVFPSPGTTQGSERSERARRTSGGRGGPSCFSLWGILFRKRRYGPLAAAANLTLFVMLMSCSGIETITIRFQLPQPKH